MASITEEEVRLIEETVERCGSQQKAAEELGLTRSAVRRRLEKAETLSDLLDDSDPIELPEFPEDDISAEEIIDIQRRRFQKRKASYAAHTWFPVKVKDDKPIGVLWFGDPHVDDNGCDWDTLTRHINICKSVPGVYGANIGDTTNCWGGRLIRKYADQDASLKTARKMAKWFMLDAGIRWLIWLHGNHEHMGDGVGILTEMARTCGTARIPMHDWEARFRLVFPNKKELRINAAHDFAGNSQWNPIHGPMKEGQMGVDADLYVCGHKHNSAIFQFPNAKRDRFQTFIRTRGYKFFDDYARRLGKAEQEDGCGILTIVRQDGHPAAYMDVEEGAEYLTWLRKKAK